MKPREHHSAVRKRTGKQRRRTQEQRRTETRLKLLDAAIQVLHDFGLARFTISQIATRARLTTGALQHHFPTSYDLLRGVIKAIFPMLQIQVFDSRISTQSVSVRVARIVDLYWQRLYGHPNYLVIWELTFGTREQPGLQNLLKDMQKEFVAKAVSDLTKLFADVGLSSEIAFRIWTFIGSQLRGLALLSMFEEQHVLTEDLSLLKEATVQLIARHSH